jgi:hypothetical protein
VIGGNPDWDGPDAMMDTARYLPGVHAAAEGDDLVGQVSIGQDRRREICNLGRLAEPADRRTELPHPGIHHAGREGARDSAPPRSGPHTRHRLNRYLPDDVDAT